MDPREAFSSSPRHCRLKAGTSQDVLAAKMGVDRPPVSAMDRDEQNATVLTPQHAALTLDVGPAALLDEATGDEGTCW